MFDVFPKSDTIQQERIENRSDDDFRLTDGAEGVGADDMIDLSMYNCSQPEDAPAIMFPVLFVLRGAMTC